LTQQFTISGTIEGNSNLTITTSINSNGGQDKELLSEIKFNAPRSYLAQNRAITADDYKSIIAQNYPEVESVAVWGGEDNDPPIYGKILISLKPYNDFVISASTKESIKNTLLSGKRSLGIQSEFVDPEYIYVNFNVNINFFSNLTTASASNLISQAKTAIETFFNLNLNKFDADFHLSKLITAIDNVSTAIAGTLVKISLQKRLNPTLNVNNSFTGVDLIKVYNKL